MNIHLLSQDPELCRLCREVLSELPGRSTLSIIGPEQGASDADLYIWDFDPDLPIPVAIEQSRSRRLLLARPIDLAGLPKQIIAQGNVLLKPVTRATLSVFLELSLLNHAADSLLPDRDEILESLIHTNLRLQQYDHERTGFLARATHDFRAPLTALSGYCGLLLDRPVGSLDDHLREVLQRMRNSVQRLSRMASAMWMLSAGRQVKKPPEREKGDLLERLNQSLHEIALIASEKGIRITASLAPCEELYFDPDQIEQVLVNLLDNACRFTPHGGSIEIRGYPWFWERRADSSPASARPASIDRRRGMLRQPNSYRVDIGDSGPAIPEQHLQHIFDEYTSYAGNHRERSGTGLGLAICKMILSQHEGKIWAENTDLGPVFSFVLPTRRLEPPPQAVNGISDKELQWVEIGAR